MSEAVGVAPAGAPPATSGARPTSGQSSRPVPRLGISPERLALIDASTSFSVSLRKERDHPFLPGYVRRALQSLPEPEVERIYRVTSEMQLEEDPEGPQPPAWEAILARARELEQQPERQPAQ